MPYISSLKREGLIPHSTNTASAPSELAYQIVKLCEQYVEVCTPSYLTFAEVLGAIEGAKLEFFRRRISSYEESLIQKHGDIFPLDAAPTEDLR